MFRGLVGSKTLTREDMASAISLCTRRCILSVNKTKKLFFLISAKNVARDIAEKLCESVSTKLEGKVLGTLNRKFSITNLLLKTSVHF